MLKNYFKLAWRNLVKDRQFTFLNLIGLSTGLACAFLIYLWVNDELSVDKFNEKDSQLYQVLKTSPGSGRYVADKWIALMIAQAITSGFRQESGTIAMRRTPQYVRSQKTT